MNIKEGYKQTEVGIIPEDWIIVNLEDLGSTYNGLSGKTKSDFGSGKPFITYMNVFSNAQINKNMLDYVNINKNESQNKVEYGDIFFTVSSETLEEVGMSSVLLAQMEEDTYLNSFCFGFRLNNFNSLFPMYASYLLREFNTRKRIKFFAAGTTRINISKVKLLKLKLPLPPIEEQKKIAEILSSVDQKIAFVESQIEETKLLKKGLMQKLLTQGIGHTEFKDSELGRIPAEWEILKFKEITKVRQGLQIPISKRKKEKCENCYQYITIQFIKNNKDIEYIENPQNSVICTEKDILMTRTGNTGIVVTNVNGVFHNNFFLIDFDRTKISKEYLVYYLNSYSIQKEILLKAGATTIPDLNHGDFYSIKFIRPPLEEQKQIAEILSTADEKLENLKAKKESFEKLKKGLMQKLLTGEVRVKCI